MAQHMTVADQVRTDITSAMKAGEKDRVGALRLVLSELQKAAKEGSDDELAVLRRERKRRLDAASQFRDGGRPSRWRRDCCRSARSSALCGRGWPRRSKGRWR